MEIKVLSKLPKVPEEIKDNKIAVKLWKDLMKTLIDNQLISKIDIPVITFAIEQRIQYMECEDMDEKRKALKCYVDLLKPYGLTPKERQKLKQPINKENEQKTSFDEGF